MLAGRGQFFAGDGIVMTSQEPLDFSETRGQIQRKTEEPAISLSPVEIIRKKRDGQALSENDIQTFISGAAKNAIPDYQVTAWLMATYFQGMTFDETCALTKAMIDSGRKVQFEDTSPKVDKHSTGGVGDKVSLILAPLVASLGVDVPMVSGRGLGHTGGTLDKLESIPGFRVNISIDEFVALVRNHGLAMMGQTADFVPADKLLYALRDVTGTVECIPLITASILSKKVAEGISGLVLDIKVGTGAFMKTLKDAERLARALVGVGSKLNLKVRAVLTDMNQPLGFAIGHSLEVLECIEIMRGKGPADLRNVTIELAAHMLILGKKATSIAAARAMARKALQNGTALAKFREMCQAQGAKVDVVEHPEALQLSRHAITFNAPRMGIISRVNGEGLGLLLMRMGGGRQKRTDVIDYGVGFQLHAKLGSKVRKAAPIATIYYSPEKLEAEGLTVEAMLEQLASHFSIGAKQPQGQALGCQLIKKVIE